MKFISIIFCTRREIARYIGVTVWMNHIHKNTYTGYPMHPVGRSWASYQIRKNASCACAGNAENVFPTTAG